MPLLWSLVSGEGGFPQPTHIEKEPMGFFLMGSRKTFFLSEFLNMFFSVFFVDFSNFLQTHGFRPYKTPGWVLKGADHPWRHFPSGIRTDLIL